MSGTLYLVATPIGNLEDITLRALRILKEADIIACEDTRRSIKLLNHYNIKNKLISYYKFNQKKQEDSLIALLAEGKNIALISDAGTPAVNDPGEFLIARCVKENITVCPIPGACAFICALISSGIETSEFTFLGYAPRSTGGVTGDGSPRPLQKFLEKIKNEQKTVIFYETPHRLKNTLEAILKTLGNRKICVAKELTKIHEKFITDYAENILNNLPETVKGEYVIIMEGIKPVGTGRPSASSGHSDLSLQDNDEIIEEIKKHNDTPAKELAKTIAEKYGISKNESYQLIIQNRNDK